MKASTGVRGGAAAAPAGTPARRVQGPQQPTPLCARACRWANEDLTYGVRVCIGGMASSWVAGVAPGTDLFRQPLGYALMNSFGAVLPPNDTPKEYIYKDVFVFSR